MSVKEALANRTQENVQVKSISQLGLNIGFTEFTQLENKISEGVTVT